MKRYYECHITIHLPVGDSFTRTYVAREVHNIGWTFSAIDGDPDLGSGVKAYATKHFNARRTCEGVVKDLEESAAKLASWGCMILRKKVEFVMYDVREA